MASGKFKNRIRKLKHTPKHPRGTKIHRKRTPKIRKVKQY
jgi:hypothetical protein